MICPTPAVILTTNGTIWKDRLEILLFSNIAVAVVKIIILGILLSF